MLKSTSGVGEKKAEMREASRILERIDARP
jgi:hypothetical protein